MADETRFACQGGISNILGKTAELVCMRTNRPLMERGLNSLHTLSVIFFSILKKSFRDTLILHIACLIMKINACWGDLSDISAKTTSLHAILQHQCSDVVFADISDRSPQQAFIFIIKHAICRIKVSRKLF